MHSCPSNCCTHHPPPPPLPPRFLSESFVGGRGGREGGGGLPTFLQTSIAAISASSLTSHCILAAAADITCKQAMLLSQALSVLCRLSSSAASMKCWSSCVRDRCPGKSALLVHTLRPLDDYDHEEGHHMWVVKKCNKSVVKGPMFVKQVICSIQDNILNSSMELSPTTL